MSSTLPSSSSISSTSSLPNLPHPRSSTNTNTVACRRLQRQLNVQLQSCNTHMKTSPPSSRTCSLPTHNAACTKPQPDPTSPAHNPTPNHHHRADSSPPAKQS